MPRYPKPAEARRNRWSGTPNGARLPASHDRPTPPLPGASKLLAETRRWWATVWASPMAAQWIDADVPTLVRLARMRDLEARGKGSSALAAQITSLEGHLGLTPAGRRRLGWTVEQATPDARTGRRGRWDDVLLDPRQRVRPIDPTLVNGNGGNPSA